MTATSARTGYAPVNGLEMYYEVHGAGKPLVLLHGGLETISRLWRELLPVLAQGLQVLAVELQGHGHTADIDRPLTYEQLADDVAALIGHLGLESADILGFSVGGGVALQTAIRHPGVVRKLVVVSAPCKSDGWYSEILAGIAEMNAEEMIGSPWHEAYISVARKPEEWPRLVAKTGQLVSGQTYDWSPAVAAIKAPVLIVIGDADSGRLSHAVEMFGLLGGGKADGEMGGLPNSQLAVLPGATHLNIFSRVDLLATIFRPFLAAPLPESR